MHGETETDPADPFDLNFKNCFSLDFFFFFFLALGRFSALG